MSGQGKTVLGPTCLIKGEVTAQEDILIQGAVEGNVGTTQCIPQLGQVTGDVACADLRLEQGGLKGRVQCSGLASVARGALVEGDVHAQEFSLSGRLHGNVHCAGTARFTASAQMEGDVYAGALKVEEGAAMEGGLHIPHTEEGD